MTSLADRAATIKVTRSGHHRPEPDHGYADRLKAETEASLNQSPSWRAGRPLDESERWSFGPYESGGNASRSELSTEELRRRATARKRKSRNAARVARR